MTHRTERQVMRGEIKDVLDNDIMTHEQLLEAFLSAMETPEIRENWQYIKDCHDLNDALYDGGEWRKVLR